MWAALTNAMIVAVFAMLASEFGHWWIVLFAVLFMMSSKSGGNVE